MKNKLIALAMLPALALAACDPGPAYPDTPPATCEEFNAAGDACVRWSDGLDRTPPDMSDGYHGGMG